MQIIWAKAALTPEGWQSDVQIAVVGTGVIATVDANSPPEGIREDSEFEKLACCRGDENLDTFIYPAITDWFPMYGQPTVMSLEKDAISIASRIRKDTSSPRKKSWSG